MTQPFEIPYTRESGILASTDEAGRELRLHRNDSGMYLAIEWRTDPDGIVHAALRTGLTEEQWVACGRVLGPLGLRA